MIYRMPRKMPPWPQMLEDLGNPHPWSLAQFLGVDVRTVRRWNKSGEAPRPVALALFWLTRWGQSEIDCEQFNRANNASALARSLRGELDTARGEAATLRASLAATETALRVSRGRVLALAHGVFSGGTLEPASFQGLHLGFQSSQAPLVDDGPAQQGQRPRLTEEGQHVRAHA